MRSSHVANLGTSLIVNMVVLPFHFTKGETYSFNGEFLPLPTTDVDRTHDNIFKGVLHEHFFLTRIFANLYHSLIEVLAKAAILVEVGGTEVEALRDDEVLDVNFASNARRTATDRAGTMLC